jgi:uncharacterized protein
MDLTFILWILGIVLFAIGTAGLVVPAMPGAPVLYAGSGLGAWADDFAYVGWGTLIILGLLALLTYTVDFAATAFGAKRFGASRRAITGAAIGALVGLISGLPGVLVGPFAGALIAEISAQRDLHDATRAGTGQRSEWHSALPPSWIWPFRC